jgi:hypothetical protein
MLSGAVVTDVRAALTDPNATRWTNTTLYAYIFAGEKIIVELHPEAQYHTRVAKATVTLCTALTDTLTIGEHWQDALTHYVAWRCFLEDSDSEGNAKLAAIHYKSFQEMV